MFIYLNTVKKKVIEGENYTVIEAILTYMHDYYPVCEIIDESHYDIIKWLFRRNYT